MPEPRIIHFHRPTSSISSTAIKATPTIVSVPAPVNLSAHHPGDPRLQYPGTNPHARLLPSPSPARAFSRSPSPGPVFTGRLPRTSSLLPPPHIATPHNAGHGQPIVVSRGPSPVAGQTKRPQTPPHAGVSVPATSNLTSHHETAYGRQDPSGNLHRWSNSTGSSRASIVVSHHPHSRFAGRTSADATGSLDNSPPSSRPSPRKLQKVRRPSAPPHHYPDSAIASSTASGAYQPSTGSSSTATAARIEGSALSEGNTTMQYDQGTEGYRPSGHSRNRSGKGSGELIKTRPVKPPSQKAMLSRALQKANTAVQLDNAQNFEGARQAYDEACDLLHQVLQRTNADEDKRKLEAIRQTYTSRIEELDQMSPWQEELDAKALPARPESEMIRPESVLDLDDEDIDEADGSETDNMTSFVDEGSQSPPTNTQYQETSDADPRSRLAVTHPEHGFLQSSFSKSPVRLRSPDNLVLQRNDEHPYLPAPLSPRRQPSPSGIESEDTIGPLRSEYSLPVGSPEEQREVYGHFREESQNSWLDPIEESGGSTTSSVHSRTSSLGFRRRHIRAASGNTEAEFDTALDAAIEAAYDEGYEPMDEDGWDTGEPLHQNGDAVANVMRKVELAREHVRQTELEAYGMEHERRLQGQLQDQERELLPAQPLSSPQMADFYDDNSSDEEERILEEMTRGYTMDQQAMNSGQQGSLPRESDSSGFTSRTWHSSMGSNPATAATSLSTVKESSGLTNSANPAIAPAAPPPTQSLPELPPNRPSSAAQSVRNRRMSGQNPKQLKIETTKLNTGVVNNPVNLAQSKLLGQDADTQPAPPRSVSALRRPSEPFIDPLPSDVRAPASPSSHPGAADGDDNAGRSGSPTVHRLKKNFSSSSLRSTKTRNMSISNLDDNSDMSPGTPSGTPFGSSRAPAIPALPTPFTSTFRERMDPSGSGGFFLFDDNVHSPTVPGSPGSFSSDAPVPLEPCPNDFMMRPFWLMRCLYQTLAHPRGGYLSTKLFVPRDVWRVKGVKLKNIEDKVANCDFLTAALLKIAKVDTCDADAMLEEMQSLEGILEQVQAALTRKLGNEVGVPSSGALFRDASGGADGDGSSAVPRSASISGKASSFSWRRLRSKNSAAALGNHHNHKLPTIDASKEAPSLPTLPMTAHPTNRPAKRDLTQTQFTGPNAMYMSSLARLFDAAQAIDQIARQVEDPGLRHADKTQVGLELCTRHAAEFFGFYICRFVLSDLAMLLDKFIKRGSEWVLA